MLSMQLNLTIKLMNTIKHTYVHFTSLILNLDNRYMQLRKK